MRRPFRKSGGGETFYLQLKRTDVCMADMFIFSEAAIADVLQNRCS